MKVSIIGTVGIPANYGGFETLVEQLVRHNHSDELQYTVYCSTKSYSDQRWVYHGAKTEYVGFNANGIQSIPYDIISLMRASRTSDVIVILGVSGCSFLPIYRIFSKKKIIINIDGLEHRRNKWNKWVRRFLKFSEKQAVKYGDIIVTDNKGITNYVMAEYGKSSELIAYGGDHVISDLPEEEQINIITEYNLTKNNYALGICRIEPENNVHIILEAYEQHPEKTLLFIGNWQRSEYGRNLFNRYKNSTNIKLISAVYVLDRLYALRNNCQVYLHGHSAGGTNPSLVEAMFFAKPIIAFDCIYNRESTENKAIYFSSATDLSSKLTNIQQSIGDELLEIANRRYRWEQITNQYENLYI